MIEIISATRGPRRAIFGETRHLSSLRRLKYDNRLIAQIAFENKRGLPEIFNARILAPGSAEMLVFIHNDVRIVSETPVTLDRRFIEYLCKHNGAFGGSVLLDRCTARPPQPPKHHASRLNLSLTPPTSIVSPNASTAPSAATA